MKRILLLTAVFIMMLGTNFSSAQTDADNFYKSDLVSVKKVSFLLLSAKTQKGINIPPEAL